MIVLIVIGPSISTYIFAIFYRYPEILKSIDKIGEDGAKEIYNGLKENNTLERLYLCKFFLLN